jgi:DNA-binding NarL/FixJ family response regulator
MTIVLLDDDPNRIREMKRCLSAKSPSSDVITFDNAPDLIAWVKLHSANVELFCLDHDLGPNRPRRDEIFDPGTGRDVANFLATLKPTCPVLVHTTNHLAAPGMAMVLEDAGWTHESIAPYNDLQWIRSEWISIVTKLIQAS